MKYKLINSVSKIETICDKVTIDGFDYYVSDGEIFINNWYYLPRTNNIYQCKEDPTELNLERRVGIGKVIATNNPNIDIPKVVDEVDELYEEVYNSDFSEKYEDEVHYYSFIEAHNKSQQTHPFSEEDMIEFGKWIALNCYRFTPNYKGEDKTTWWDEGDLHNHKKENPISTQELLQLWKEQQPKTLYYE